MPQNPRSACETRRMASICRERELVRFAPSAALANSRAQTMTSENAARRGRPLRSSSADEGSGRSMPREQNIRDDTRKQRIDDEAAKSAPQPPGDVFGKISQDDISAGPSNR